MPYECSKKYASTTNTTTRSVAIKMGDDDRDRDGVCGLYFASVVAVPHR
jgi:hypothetical protein